MPDARNLEINLQNQLLLFLPFWHRIWSCQQVDTGKEASVVLGFQGLSLINFGARWWWGSNSHMASASTSLILFQRCFLSWQMTFRRIRYGCSSDSLFCHLQTLWMLKGRKIKGSMDGHFREQKSRQYPKLEYAIYSSEIVTALDWDANWLLLLL